MPSVPLFADIISLNTVAENGIISLGDVNSAGSVNFALLECFVLSPNTISTTFTPSLSTTAVSVKSLIFSNAL